MGRRSLAIGQCGFTREPSDGEGMNLSEQFWLSVLIQVGLGVAIVAMMKQQLRDLVGWVKRQEQDLRALQTGHTDHEGRISHLEGRVGVPRGGE